MKTGILLVVLIVVLMVIGPVMLVDAYTYEITGDCSDCWLLKDWFDR